MKAALNERNLVRQTLDAEIPGYVPWFRNFRDERNALKEGIPAHTRGGEGPGIPVDYGLGFTDSGDHLQCDQVARPDRSVGDVSCGRESRSRTPEAPRGDVAAHPRKIARHGAFPNTDESDQPSENLRSTIKSVSSDLRCRLSLTPCLAALLSRHRL